MMLNREFYEKDPLTNRLLNNGVAKVTTGQSDPEIETLRYEISNFVCDGQYADGLNRILSAYLGNLDKTEQPGIWVSGFYGSGKSHLVKMLQHFWIDYEFPDGAKARGLPKKIPDKIKDQFKELSTAARRAGGLHAAAGTLGSGAGGSVRLELLGIIFKSANLPEQYASASFVMWLRHEGLENAGAGPPDEGRSRLRFRGRKPVRLRRDGQGDPRGPPGLRPFGGRGQAAAGEAVPGEDRRLDRRDDHQDQAGDREEGEAALHPDRPRRGPAVHRRRRSSAPRTSRTSRSNAAPGWGRT